MEKIVIVTNAEKRSALEVIRSLGKQGIKVIACSDTKYSPGFYSKYCYSHFIYPSPQNNVKHFLKKMNQVCTSLTNPVIFPIGDDINLIFSKNKFPFKILISDPIEYALNKKKLFNYAKKENILIPATKNIKAISELKSTKFPCILKPISSMYIKQNKINKTNVCIIKNKTELITKGSKLIKEFGEVLLQEFVQGKGVGYFAISNNGKILNEFQHKRLREVPYTGGPSSLRKSIFDKQLQEISSKLLKKLKWSGLAMVEFRKDGNKLYLMEINGRAWGSLALAQHAGIDFPKDLYNLYFGTKPILQKYIIGVKTRWLIPGDIYYLVSILKSNLSLKEKLKCVRKFVSFKNEKFDYLQKDDLLPAILFIFFLGILSLKKVIKL